MEGTPVALITGAARGIGAACARALAAEGFRIALHYRSSGEAARRLAAELPGAVALQGDLAETADIDRIAASLREEFGRVDVLVNNAGLNRNGATATMRLEDYDAVAGVSRGTWYLTKLILRRFMLRQKAGRIINISSVVGRMGNRDQAPYAMAKAGLDAMTRSLTAELGDRAILVNSVAPGFIDTDMTAELPEKSVAEISRRIPMARMGRPEEVADVVAFLAVRGSYIHGAVIHVNGGLFPG